jgi:peptide chain release factor
MALLQISSNTGPVECCFAVSQLVEKLCMDASEKGISVSVLEFVEGPAPGTMKSVLLDIDSGDSDHEALAFGRQWEGSLLWVSKSHFRPESKRKNWFVDASLFERAMVISDAEIRYEATKSSGPGGQHVNKTESAIRATHVKTGLSVKVQTERSQHANKKLAKRLLEQKISLLNQNADAAHKADRRMKHHVAVRGNPARIFSGIDFLER